MSFPVTNPESFVPIFTSYCIDYRYDSLSSDFLKAIGYANSYFLATNAGAALPLGYKKSCRNICCTDNDKKCSKKKCCPGDDLMTDLRNSFTTNLRIALTLRPINTVYLLNHQDCGAIRAFLPCSGYPASGEEDKNKEICINAKILTAAHEFVKKKFGNMRVILGLIDVNGTVADYDLKTKKWVIIYVGPGQNTDGLWFGFAQGEEVTINCHCGC
jgi:hypothetical protein